MTERRAICERGHGYAVREGCLDCLALERERAITALRDLSWTDETLRWCAGATLAPQGDRLAELAAFAAMLEVFANASPDDTCGSLTAVADSCSYWAQALAQKLVRS